MNVKAMKPSLKLVDLSTLMILITMVATPAIARQDLQPQFAPPRNQGAGQPTAAPALVSVHEDYRIGKRDIIQIQIDRAPQLSGTFQVGADGTFAMPYLNRVSAEDKTPEELAVFIADSLRGRYLKNPIVTVTIRQVNSRSYFIQGAVRRPGLYQIEGRATLLMLISVAGGLADNHGSTAYVIHGVQSKKVTQTGMGQIKSDQGEPEYELKTANISGLLKGRFDQDIVIQPGDIINVPVADLFFVAGEVNAPGSFPLKEGTTLRQAILMAQGPTFKAVMGRGTIFREDTASGKRQEIKVDIGAVMNGKQEDMPVLANDIIIVPNSRMKSVTSALLTALGLNYPRILLRRN